jgi:hypothetical protein
MFGEISIDRRNKYPTPRIPYPCLGKESIQVVASTRVVTPSTRRGKTLSSAQFLPAIYEHDGFHQLAERVEFTFSTSMDSYFHAICEQYKFQLLAEEI